MGVKIDKAHLQAAFEAGFERGFKCSYAQKDAGACTVALVELTKQLVWEIEKELDRRDERIRNLASRIAKLEKEA